MRRELQAAIYAGLGGRSLWEPAADPFPGPSVQAPRVVWPCGAPRRIPPVPECALLTFGERSGRVPVVVTHPDGTRWSGWASRAIVR
jgi:hypothetical protein